MYILIELIQIDFTLYRVLVYAISIVYLSEEFAGDGMRSKSNSIAHT